MAFIYKNIVGRRQYMLDILYSADVIFSSQEQEIFLNCFQSHNGEAMEIPLEIVHTPDISDRCLRVRF